MRLGRILIYELNAAPFSARRADKRPLDERWRPHCPFERERFCETHTSGGLMALNPFDGLDVISPRVGPHS
jgi:hypothetical protein